MGYASNIKLAAPDELAQELFLGAALKVDLTADRLSWIAFPIALVDTFSRVMGEKAKASLALPLVPTQAPTAFPKPKKGEALSFKA